MNSKVVMAGVIAGLVVVCAMAATALSVSPNNRIPQPAATCQVHGYVVDTFGEGIPGLTVTLHVIGQDGELYNMTTVTNDQPVSGQYSFDSVAIPQGAKYAYVETSKVTGNGNITAMGWSDNYSLNASDNLAMSIVLMLLP